MYTGLLHLHSILRYFLLVMLIVVIAQALIGVVRRSPYSAWDNRASLFLFILTHIQLLIGLILYFVSYSGGHRVQFNSETMTTPALRYFAVEHVVAMLVAIVLITVGRSTTKKLVEDQAKHKRMLILNTLALLIILGTVYGLGAGYNTL